MEHRKFRRPSLFDAVLRAESGDHSVTIRNVTPDGVNVAGLGGIVFPEAEVSLILRNQKLPGHVSWVYEDVAGVKLNAPMPKKLELLITRGCGRAGLTGPARW